MGIFHFFHSSKKGKSPEDGQKSVATELETLAIRKMPSSEKKMSPSRNQEPDTRLQNKNSSNTSSGSESVPVSSVNNGKTVSCVYPIADMENHTDALLKEADSNEDYLLSADEIAEYGLTGEKIYQYEFYPQLTSLQAVSDSDDTIIEVLTDGNVIGKILPEHTGHILQLLLQGRIDSLYCEIHGGAYRYPLSYNGTVKIKEGKDPCTGELYIDELQ